MIRIRLDEGEERQTTIAESVSMEGLSANDFRDCRAEFLPAMAGTGIVFETRRGPISATIDNYDWDEPRHTASLRKGDGWVRTVEHLLSAINGLGIDNLTVRLRPCGIPFKDFSAEAFCRTLAKAGKKQLEPPRRIIRVEQEFLLADAEGDRYIRFFPTCGDDLTVKAIIDFPPPVGRMECRYDSAKTEYIQEVAWARSFVCSPLEPTDSDKWNRIRQLYPILPENPAESPLITYDRQGFLTPLRSPDEPGRHKLLDFMGDIFLLGHRLAGGVEIYKPGHRFTADVVRRLMEQIP